MDVLTFITIIIVVIAVVFISIGFICMRYDTTRLEEENEKLRQDLQRARARKPRTPKKEVRK